MKQIYCYDENFFSRTRYTPIIILNYPHGDLKEFGFFEFLIKLKNETYRCLFPISKIKKALDRRKIPKTGNYNLRLKFKYDVKKDKCFLKDLSWSEVVNDDNSPS